MPSSLSLTGYSSLLAKVRQTLLEGQQRIEEQKVRTYWQTGKIIHQYILKYQERAEYGAEVFKRLSEDLDVQVSTMQRCVQFVKTYPQLPNSDGRRNFTWSHFRKLITISDDKTRKHLELEVQRNAWTSDELINRIKAERLTQPTENISPQTPEPSTQTQLLKSSCGIPYTYQIVERVNLKTGKTGLRLDLGFGVFCRNKKYIGSFGKDTIVESVKKGENYKLHKTKRTAKDLYTYWAEIEKVSDGDTVKVRFDLGFDMEKRITLRLRGLDCPEMDTKEGAAAKAFVQSYLKEEEFVLVHTKRADKYDRYLADIFIPKEDPEPDFDVKKVLEEGVYLNNVLLENGQAVRYEE